MKDILNGYEVLEEIRDRVHNDFVLSDREAERIFYSYVEQEKRIELRDQFAMAALTGILVWDGTYNMDGATTAYKYADAMLKARG